MQITDCISKERKTNWFKEEQKEKEREHEEARAVEQ